MMIIIWNWLDATITDCTFIVYSHASRYKIHLHIGLIVLRNSQLNSAHLNTGVHRYTLYSKYIFNRERKYYNDNNNKQIHEHKKHLWVYRYNVENSVKKRNKKSINQLIK